jgi:phospholipid/cholesterol/gamma-HCH transport system ATP-binding protein
VGKSVLLKLANGLLRPDQGSILLFGEEISHMPEEQLFPLRTRTGMVFQEGALFDSLTVRDNVAYQLIQERVPDDEIDRRVREALRFVELEETFALYPSSLSGGMRRRVAIARASSASPNCCSTTRPPAASTRHLHHHHRAGRQGARRLPHAPRCWSPIACRTPSPSAPPLRPEQGRMVPLPKGQTDPNTTFLMLEEGRLIFDGSLHDYIRKPVSVW